MDYSEEQSNELEALAAIYSNELEIVSRKPVPKFTIHLKSDPQTIEEDVPSIIYEVVIEFALPETYPDSVPDIVIQESVNLDDCDEQELLELLETEANSSVGMVMTFILVSVAIDWINRKADEKRREYKDALDKKKREEEEAEMKKFEGTRVTVETFMVWKTKFDEELKKADKNWSNKQEISKRLTGKQLFEQNKSLIESDLQFLDDQDLDIDVTVDESLFQDIDELDIDDNDDR